MLLQEDICIVQILLVFHCGTDLGHLIGRDGRGFVTEAVAGEGKDSGNFVVFQQMFKRRHRHLAGILHALDGDGACLLYTS